MPWPRGPAADVARTLRVQLARLLELDVRQSADELERLVQQRVAEHPGPVLISLQAPELDAAQAERVQAIAAYFKSWPQNGKPELVVISWAYSSAKRGFFSALLARGTPAEQRVKDIIAALESSSPLPPCRETN